MYAAQLFHSVRQALRSLGEDIAAGNLQPLFHWLQHNIWRHGSRFPTETLIANATGEALNPRYFRQHLENRYLYLPRRGPCRALFPPARPDNAS